MRNIKLAGERTSKLIAGRRRDEAVAFVTAVKTQLNQMPKRALTRAENDWTWATFLGITP